MPMPVSTTASVLAALFGTILISGGVPSVIRDGSAIAS